MRKIENINSLEPQKRTGALFRQALETRYMLERAWDADTAFQGITLAEDDPISRGQCGVSSVWLGRLLVDQGVDAQFVEGKIYVKNQTGDDHVWVEVRGLTENPLVVDVTSDQYATIFGSAVHMGQYGGNDETVGRYTPESYFDPYNFPHRKLLARFALLEQNIAQLPRRHRLVLPKIRRS